MAAQSLTKVMAMMMMALVALLLLSHMPHMVAAQTEENSCEDCKFFPTVCKNIDFCIEKCNIAPTMKDSCSDVDGNDL